MSGSVLLWSFQTSALQGCVVKLYFGITHEWRFQSPWECKVCGCQCLSEQCGEEKYLYLYRESISDSPVV